MKIKLIENYIMRTCCLFVGLLFINWNLNNDCWFLLNHGRYVVEHGIPYVEPFTIHENFSFVMQQWLSSVIFWEIYRFFNIEGLICFLYPMGALTIYGVYRLTLMASEYNKDTALVLSSFIGMLVCCFFITNRPQIFSTLIFIIEIACLEHIRKTNSKTWLALFPFLSIALVNLHAAMWPMLLIFLVPFILEYLDKFDTNGYFKKEEKISLKYILIVTILIFFSGFINPYGWEAMMYVFRSYGYDIISNTVLEMQPLTIRSIIGKFSILLFAFVVGSYSRHKVPIRYFVITLLTMGMAMSSLRSLYLFLAIGLYPLAYVYGNWNGFGKKTIENKNIKLRKLLITMIVCSFMWMIYNNHDYILTPIKSIGVIFFSCGFIILLIFSIIECKYGSLNLIESKLMRFGYVSVFLIMYILLSVFLGNSIASIKKEPISAKAVEYLLHHDNPENIRLWTGYYEGAYAEFNGLRCFIDPRAEVFLSSNNKQRDVFYEYISLQTGRTDYRTFLSWYDFNYILVTENDIMYTYLPSDENYELVLDDITEDGKKFCLYHVKPR